MTLPPSPDLPPRIQFRTPRPYDRREVSKLCARRTGFEQGNTLDLLFDDDHAVYGVLAIDVERIVGVGIVQVFHRSGAADYLSVDTEGYPIGEANAVLHVGVVHEDWEDRGLGTELMRIRLDFIREAHDPDAAFGVAWLRPHTVDSSALFEKFGFDRLDTVAEYYRGSRGEHGCPDCGRPCTCTAAIYGMAFD